MFPNHWFSRFMLALPIVALCVGCSDADSARLEVTGTVKLKGEPLKEGVIEFQPRETDANSSQSGAMIANGSYVVPKESGLYPGKYRVLITAGDGQTPVTGGPPGPTGANIVSKDLIPSEYNVDSKQEVEVKTDGPNVFNYDIP